MIVAAASLMVIAYLALGALLQLLVRDLPTGLGLTGLIVSPAFGFVGVGFPILAMNAFSIAWGAILPLRWYMEVLLGQAARGLPLQDSARPFAALAGLAVLFALLALLRLRSVAARIGREAPRPEPVPPAAAPRSVGEAFAAEWGRVLGMRGPFAILIMAPLIYGVYLSATLSGPDPAQDPDRGRRQRPERSEPEHRADLGRERCGQRGGAGQYARRGACRGRPRRGLRGGRHPARHRAGRAQGHGGSHSDLRRCHLPVRLPDDRQRHRGRDQYALRPNWRRAARAPMAASSRRRSPPRARPTPCCSRSSIRSAAMRATSCRRPSC